MTAPAFGGGASPVVDEAGRGLEWLRAFREEHGRPLGVLHIGNIANNAYNNAKIQRQRGIEADVACWGYYHVMGCPEWEDADFDGDVVDYFFPDWWNVDLRGFRRPRWFAQGGVAACQRYLLARRRGQRLATAVWWRRLLLERWVLCRSSQAASVTTSWARLAKFLMSFGLRSTVRLRYGLRRRVLLLREAARSARHGSAASSLAWTRAVFRHARPEELALLTTSASTPASKTDPSPLLARWSDFFPERAPPTNEDVADYAPALPRWSRLFREYDVVQAYALDPIIPALCGHSPFAGYEHGTLRELPFEESARGRICALGYRSASAVFVTNSDVLPSLDRLGLDPERVVLLPHAVDSDRLLRFGADHAGLAPRAGDPVTFVSPTRQDWVDADPSWTKGNDRVIRALAMVRDRGLECRVLLGEWGRDLEASKALVAKLSVDDLVEWIPPLRKTALWNAYLSSHAVLDQFMLPAIGGVAFEAMALGRRVITALDTAAAERFFGAAPPLFACSEPEEIAEALAAVINDPLDQRGLGEAAREWFSRYHSADRIVDFQASAYRRMLRENR